MRPEVRERVYEALDGEREYQEKKWSGYRGDGDTPSMADTIACMESYMSKAKEEWVNGPGKSPHTSRDMLRKVVALGVRHLEIHGCPKRS